MMKILIYVLIGIMVVGLAVFLAINNDFKSSDIETNQIDIIEEDEGLKPSPKATPIPSKTPEDIIITILAAGDAMAHESQLIHDYDNNPDTYEFGPSFSEIKESVSKADFAMLNLETSVAGSELGYSGYPDFNTPISFVKAIQDCGFDLITLSNNHVIDRGEIGVKNTIENLNALGVDHTGLSHDEATFYDYYIKDIEGIKVAVLAYTWKSPSISNYENGNYILRFWDDTEQVKQDINNVRAFGADVVIMVPHWGEEYHRNFSKKQRKMAEEFISYGADIIFGSHPHVVQPIERISVEDEKGNSREGIVVYSLGNFLANMRNRYNNTGILASIQIRKSHDGQIKFGEISYIPTLIKSTRIYRIEASDHVILPAGKYVNDPLLFRSLDDEHQEKITDAYNDMIEIIDPDVATLKDE